MRLTVAGVTIRFDGTTVLAGADLEVEPGEFVGLVGPNGSGKSTLLRTIYRALRPVVGAVRIAGDDVWELTARESARRTAAVIQEGAAEFEFTVFDVVAMGRNPHKRSFDRDTTVDEGICRDALERVGMVRLARRDFDTLSGGEKQRVQIARALAQQSPVLVLDEPTNHLDVRFQLDLLDLIRSLGLTTIAAMHDLNLAAGHCDRIYVLETGAVVASGPPDDVLTTDLVARVFGVGLRRWVDPDTAATHLSFHHLTEQWAPDPRMVTAPAAADRRDDR